MTIPPEPVLLHQAFYWYIVFCYIVLEVLMLFVVVVQAVLNVVDHSVQKALWYQEQDVYLVAFYLFLILFWLLSDPSYWR